MFVVSRKDGSEVVRAESVLEAVRGMYEIDGLDGDNQIVSARNAMGVIAGRRKSFLGGYTIREILSQPKEELQFIASSFSRLALIVEKIEWMFDDYGHNSHTSWLDSFCKRNGLDHAWGRMLASKYNVVMFNGNGEPNNKYLDSVPQTAANRYQMAMPERFLLAGDVVARIDRSGADHIAVYLNPIFVGESGIKLILDKSKLPSEHNTYYAYVYPHDGRVDVVSAKKIGKELEMFESDENVVAVCRSSKRTLEEMSVLIGGIDSQLKARDRKIEDLRKQIKELRKEMAELRAESSAKIEALEKEIRDRKEKDDITNKCMMFLAWLKKDDREAIETKWKEFESDSAGFLTK